MMATRTLQRRPKKNGTANQLEEIYLDFLRAYYEEGNQAQAKKIATRLSAALAAHPEFADSIRAEEIRSLLAELRGDFTDAIRSRESEIRKIFELHSLALYTPSQAAVLRQYDFSDISDRLDLLAVLYADQGDLDRAVRTLRESKLFCAAHRISFDGQDLLSELERKLSSKTRKARASKKVLTTANRSK
jgi:hypothetical protein